jgi:serine protease Do
MRIVALTLALIAMPFPAMAQEDKLLPQTRAEVNYSFAPVVKKAAPAVVNIYTKQRVQVMDNLSPLMSDPFFHEFFGGHGLTFGARPREQVISSLGSGVIISPKGFIVTANHVIKGAQEITVVLSNKEEFEAKLVMKDPNADLAFLRVKADHPLPFIELRNSDTVEVGDLVLAIGNPFGVGQTVTNGIISALARKAEGVSDYQYFIQTDAAINPGNSGGALVTMDGKLVGINTAIYSRSGGSQGIGFAIPSNMVRSLMESKVEGGRVVRPWLGAAVQPVTREIAESVGLKTVQGVIIRSVYPGSPAEKGSLKTGDIILAVAGTAVSSPEDFKYRLALSKIGAPVTFDVFKGGAQQAVEIALAAPPARAKGDAHKFVGRNPLDGVTVEDLSPALAIEAGLDDTATGVIVLEVGPSSYGINLGWAKGDIILEVNGTKITSSEQLAWVLAKATHGWKILFLRGGQVSALTVQM